VSPRRLAASKRAEIEELLRSKYPDFGATFAAEKLFELNGIKVSRETVRRIQLSLGLARARQRPDLKQIARRLLAQRENVPF
jgi:transposase